MIIEKVTLLLPLLDPVHGTYAQIKIGGDVILQEGDEPKDAWTKVADLAEEWHKARYGTGNQPAPPSDAPLPIIPVDNTPRDRVQVLIQDIQKETVLRREDGTGGLLSWQHFVSQHTDLQEAYDQQYKKLTNG